MALKINTVTTTPIIYHLKAVTNESWQENENYTEKDGTIAGMLTFPSIQKPQIIILLINKTHYAEAGRSWSYSPRKTVLVSRTAPNCFGPE